MCGICFFFFYQLIFFETQASGETDCVLIADTYHRSVKYVQCLAGGIPISSHLWIIDTCKAGRLLDRDSYILPAGFSIITHSLSSDRLAKFALFTVLLIILFVLYLTTQKHSEEECHSFSRNEVLLWLANGGQLGAVVVARSHGRPVDHCQAR